MSMYSMFGARPMALNMAPIMSRKLSAWPVPTLKMPFTDGAVQEPAQHGDGVVDIDEVAPLVAVGDAFACAT